MQITLDSNPLGAPCCVKVVADNGRNVLFQTDWDWPSLASTFGFSLADVQPGAPDGYDAWRFGEETGTLTAEQEAAFHAHEARPKCEHAGTDGTIACPDCGILPLTFICAARQWMDDNDGATAEDPGYFDND